MNKEKTLTQKKGLKMTSDGVQNLTIFLIFVVACIIGFILQPDLFFGYTNILNIFVNSSSIIMVGAAVTLVLISGNLDLSVGGVGAMGAVLFGLMTIAGVPVLVAAVLAVLIGGGFGFLSGYSIAKFKLPSFIISLAFSYICRGVALIGAGGAVVFNLPQDIGIIGQTIGGVPMPMVYALIAVVIFMIIQGKTTFGSKVYAVGSNITNAKLSGINDKKVISRVFMGSGMMAAFAGVVLTSRLAAADSGIFPSLESDCIIVAVLGGTDINGGRGTVLGMLIGALFIAVLGNIMNMQGMTEYIQNVVRGVVLILAILMNNIIRNRIKV
ncbi:MAG: ABC transporter permease [Christensenella sp.]|uniref:ABC transporter permease n=1 Tax=Christensenella sp. TaxID=1935934 RepID=UPI002B213B39|nr:ABC transporter permease [Christensenella sp.]MEA5003503.1 ABC transporter permease [Christensenella sp.]